MKIVMKEFHALLKNLRSFTDGQVAVKDWDPDDMSKFQIEIRPKEGPYRDGVYLFTIHIPDEYPSTPPIVICNTFIYHPNIEPTYEQDGTYTNICLNLFEEWENTFDLETCIQGLLFLMYHPECGDALSPYFSGGYEDFEENLQKIKMGMDVDGVTFDHGYESETDDCDDHACGSPSDESDRSVHNSGPDVQCVNGTDDTSISDNVSASEVRDVKASDENDRSVHDSIPEVQNVSDDNDRSVYNISLKIQGVSISEDMDRGVRDVDPYADDMKVNGAVVEYDNKVDTFVISTQEVHEFSDAVLIDTASRVTQNNGSDSNDNNVNYSKDTNRIDNSDKLNETEDKTVKGEVSNATVNYDINTANVKVSNSVKNDQNGFKIATNDLDAGPSDRYNINETVGIVSDRNHIGPVVEASTEYVLSETPQSNIFDKFTQCYQMITKLLMRLCTKTEQPTESSLH